MATGAETEFDINLNLSLRSLPDVPNGETPGLDHDLFEGIMSTIAIETEIVEAVAKKSVTCFPGCPGRFFVM